MKNATLGYETIYNIQQPYSDGRIMVYGERDMCWFDYVLIDSEGFFQSRSDKQYGCPEIALRDAITEAAA